MKKSQPLPVYPPLFFVFVKRDHRVLSHIETEYGVNGPFTHLEQAEQASLAILGVQSDARSVVVYNAVQIAQLQRDRMSLPLGLPRAVDDAVRLLNGRA